jgi:hypothetical protein
VLKKLRSKRLAPVLIKVLLSSCRLMIRMALPLPALSHCQCMPATQQHLVLLIAHHGSPHISLLSMVSGAKCCTKCCMIDAG